MIRGTVKPAKMQQAKTLAVKAQAIAIAHLAQRRDSVRAWRSSSILWPNFNRD